MAEGRLDVCLREADTEKKNVLVVSKEREKVRAS